MDSLKKSGTLVIVTADHETGGFALAPKAKEDGNWDYNTIDPQFYKGADDPKMSYAAHTTTLIPVFAYGPGSELFGGVYQNTDIFHKIMELTQWNKILTLQSNEKKLEFRQAPLERE